jgi:PTH1 family peptidyl-tRNA hydrolase
VILCVGLGNPGQKYTLNRHNVGFMMINILAQDYGFPDFKAQNQSCISEGRIDGHRVILVKPMSYMNLSGHPVASIGSFYKIPPENIFVFHDDLDVPFSKIKVKTGGGHGGHNGLKSMDQCITSAYHRIRIGIGHPGDRDQVSSYVLSDFSKMEQRDLIPVLEDISRNIGSLLSKDHQKFMGSLSLKN